jgi:subtilisin family serine protease
VLDKPEGDNWNLEFINAPAAWDITTGSQAVRVAVVDADMDAEHPDLIDSVSSTFVKRTTIADGHGTHVAGTLCAQGNNNRGVSGIAWNCDLRLYDFGGVSTVRALQTMVKAVNDGAHIVNMSLQWIDNGQCGKPGTPDTLQKVRETNAIFARAIEFAQKKGQDVLWVFASGNECRDVRYASPASLVERFPDNVIVVSSIEVTGKLSPFSNFGDLVSVAAPGSQILSTLPQTCDAGVCTEQYGLKSGTSMAAPHVSGLAALVKAAHPSFSAAQIKRCIMDAATTPIQGRSFKTISAPEAVLCGDDFPSSASSQPVGGGGAASTSGTPSGGQ